MYSSTLVCVCIPPIDNPFTTYGDLTRLYTLLLE
uniref:Uncharacterized protein n=1 Tax=Anguilla anguilla TaxID=7936 RepID=A0A0E9UV68_ANGAN